MRPTIASPTITPRRKNAAKAVEYLTRSADKAARSFAHAEVVAALQEALVHAERLPVTDRDRLLLDVVLRQVHSLIFLGRFGRDTGPALSVYQPRLVQLHDPALAGPYYFWLGLTYGLLGDQQHAGHYAKQALLEAQHSNDEATMGKAYYVSIHGRLLGWAAAAGSRVRRQSRRAARALPTERYWLGMALFLSGAQCLSSSESSRRPWRMLGHAQAIGDATGNPRLQSVAAWITGWIYATQGDWATGITRCQQGLDCSPDPLNTAGALGYLGTAHLEQGDVTAGHPAVRTIDSAVAKVSFSPTAGLVHGAARRSAPAHAGIVEQGQSLARQGLVITQEVRFSYGVGDRSARPR